ncbi:MAG: response regulator, partial [Planctomycetes bacterium]|nr:response regulator [Planctomycetota bacterium]
MAKKSNFRALICDDHEEFRDLLAIFCRKEGVDLEAVENAEQLLERTDKLAGYDVLFLDVEMPGIDGFEALSRVQAAQPTLPIVMVTVREDTDSVVRALRLGAKDFIAKPLDPSRLRQALSNAISGFSPTQNDIAPSMPL